MQKSLVVLLLPPPRVGEVAQSNSSTDLPYHHLIVYFSVLFVVCWLLLYIADDDK
jgi:hypothetical protein